MSLRHDFKMPKTREHDTLVERRLNNYLGCAYRGKILFLLSEDFNKPLYEKLFTHVMKDSQNNGVHLQIINDEKEGEYILANLLTSDNGIEPIENLKIVPSGSIENAEIVSARTYMKLRETCLDPEEIREAIEYQIMDNAI